MGNVLPCLVQQAGTAAGALPAMNPKRRLISLKLLTKAIHKMKKRLGPGKAAKIDSKPLPSSATVEDGEGGEVRVEARSKATSSTNSRKGVTPGF